MSRSEILFSNAQKHIPGGVNSPVRAFRSVGGTPLFFKHAEGAYVIDEDDKRYVDYVGSWGPMILGHGHPEVLDAVRRQLEHGLSYGAPTALEVEMAELVCQLVPSMELVRMVSSGTEATMSAIRLARGYTGRDAIIKFEGCYHGHSDSLLVKAGSGALTQGVPSSAGVPADFARHTLTLPYNDIQAVEKTLAEVGKDVACIIVEPVAGNMNCVPPAPGFLEGLRALCDAHGVVLIFDEVMTGFRVALGGAQGHYGINPDLSTFGKIVGGGMPVGAFGGKRAIMECIAPLGPVYQAGTLSGNPLAMAAGLTTLRLISRPGFHAELSDYTARMLDGLQQRAAAAGIPFVTTQVGGMFGLYFSEAADIVTFDDVMTSDAERFKRFFHLMLDGGVYLAPSAFEAGFTSIAHGEAELAITLDAAERAFAALRDSASRRILANGRQEKPPAPCHDPAGYSIMENVGPEPTVPPPAEPGEVRIAMNRAGCTLLMGCLLSINPLLGHAESNSLLIPATSRCVLDTQPQDLDQALAQCRSLAEGGDAQAQFELGEFFHAGQPPRDLPEALRWYEQASLQGHAQAQLRLGTLFWHGEGVPANNVQAYVVLKMAAVNGAEEALDSADEVAEGMSPEQLEQANRVLGEIFRNYLQELQASDLGPPFAPLR